MNDKIRMKCETGRGDIRENQLPTRFLGILLCMLISINFGTGEIQWPHHATIIESELREWHEV